MAPFDPQVLVIQRFGGGRARLPAKETRQTKTGAEKNPTQPEPDFSRDIFFLFNVPTEYYWDYDAEELGIYDLRKPTRQLSEEASKDFTRMETVMLTAADMLSIFKEVDEIAADGRLDDHAQFVHRLQSWRDDSYYDDYDGLQMAFNLKRLVIFADDDLEALKNLKNGKVELKDLVLEDVSRYWAKYDIGPIGDRVHNWRFEVKDDGFVQTWGKSLHLVLEDWVGIYLEGDRHWKEMLSFDNSDVEWSSKYPMLDLPEVWFARMK